MQDIYKVLIFSAAAYVYLFIIAKILGKKQIAQLTFVDYVVGITIGSIAGEMATATDEPIYHYLVAMGIFFILDLAFELIARKSKGLKSFINGKPLIIIDDGKINWENLKKSKLTINELAGLAREKDYFDIADLSYAVFETNGTLSVLPKSEQKPIVAQDMGIQPERAGLTEFLIVDGKIVDGVLEGLQKDKAWLLSRFGVSDERGLEDIICASYDVKRDKINVFNKE